MAGDEGGGDQRRVSVCVCVCCNEWEGKADQGAGAHVICN